MFDITPFFPNGLLTAEDVAPILKKSAKTIKRYMDRKHNALKSCWIGSTQYTTAQHVQDFARFPANVDAQQHPMDDASDAAALYAEMRSRHG